MKMGASWKRWEVKTQITQILTFPTIWLGKFTFIFSCNVCICICTCMNSLDIQNIYVYMCVCVYVYVYNISLNKIERWTHFQEEKTRDPLIRLPVWLVQTRAGSRLQRWDARLNCECLEEGTKWVLQICCTGQVWGQPLELLCTNVQSDCTSAWLWRCSSCWAAAVRDVIRHGQSVKQMLEAGHLLLFHDCKLKMCLK